MSTSEFPPKTIDDVDWRGLAPFVKKIRGFPREQREIYFKNIMREMSEEKLRKLNSMFLLLDDFYNDRQFHKVVGLKYHDPRNENGQIIRIALTTYVLMS